MRLAYLDQRVPLQWGEAAQLAHAIEWALCAQLEPGVRMSLLMALSFGPLTRVRGRLRARARQEEYHTGTLPKKPRQMVLRYDEIAALLFIQPLAPAAGLAWGEVQQASFKLERYIDFTP